MLLITILLLTACFSVIINRTGSVEKVMEACVTVLCYAGVIVFITLTFTQALRNNTKH